MTLRQRLLAFTAMTMLAGTLAMPVTGHAQGRFSNMSDQQLEQMLQQLQGGNSTLSEALTARRIQQIQRELANRRSGQQQQQVQQPQQPQPQQPQVQQPADDGGSANQAARQYLRSTENVGQLNDRQLGRAIQQGQDLLQQGLRGNVQRRVQERVQQATNERQRRQSVAQPQPQQPQPQQPQVQQPTDDGGSANQAARQYLRSTENVGQLNDRQLGRAIQQGRDLLQQDLRGRIQRQVQERVQQAANEQQRRQNVAQPQPQPDNNVDRQARQLLRDNRKASALDNRELRNRLETSRELMGNKNLDRDLFRQIRRMARQDADELRTRVAQRSENREERRETRQDLRELLGDRRPASRLNDRQLQQRIVSAQSLLDARGLRPDTERQVRDILREARREKRDRLIAGRDERRERLRNRSSDFVIRIPSGRDFRARDDIAAAEADDELLQNQLTAPPTRRIERRYNRSEFRSNPRIRDFMPAIEVDTIRFGFNEAFVREEEIPQLERIGEIIERIVSANPDEVFLIEGHTDAVGSAAYNLDLSRKRADAVRDAMLQYFNIEPENIETVGYGEQFLKIETELEEPENRRVTIRRITPMLTGSR